MVFIGMNPGKGTIGYENGVEVERGSAGSQSPREQVGHLFIGRRGYTWDFAYASVEVDELAIWDRVLTPEEVQSLADMYTPFFP